MRRSFGRMQEIHMPPANPAPAVYLSVPPHP
jgi:hypothetical protein